jgi:SdrD B-like domain/Abnormal spindle-like microcephaly-assoc'd, ASPM-SPD-2-Hydin
MTQVRSFGASPSARPVGRSAERRRRWIGILSAVTVLLSLVAATGVALPTPAAAAAGTLKLGTSLTVKSTEAPFGAITSFKYIINEDNTGSTAQRSPGDGCSPADANYPESCQWTSNGITSSAPIVTQGDETDLAASGSGIALDPGRYLISVLADGFKLDGAHFTVATDGSLSMVTVEEDPTVPGLPAATIQAAVFEDISPVNGAPDLPAEHGLAGFKAGIKDYLGDVTTDVFGNPLCTEYDGAGDAIANTGGNCFSFCYVVDNGIDIGITLPNAGGRCPTVDPNAAATGLTYTTDMPAKAGSVYNIVVPTTAAIEGKVKIPNLGTNRYAMLLTAPDGTSWAQTTTLEGNHDWDAWVMEGATGLDTELAVAGEPFPGIIFGYTPGSVNTLPAAGATVRGVVDAIKVYVPPVGGLTVPAGQIWGGVNGAKIDKPINRPWIALTDLDRGDTAVYVGRGNADGTFAIDHVPDGNYSITWWDEPQDYILDLQNITVVNGQNVDTGVLPLGGWWTTYDGYVFNDTNRNGVKDVGEAGVPNYTLTMRKRENSLMDRGTTTVSTDANGYYFFESAYPMTQWLVLEAYNDLYYTTGITYQADNQPTPTTVLGAGVDVSTLPIIGLAGRLDWGVHSYDARGLNGIDPRNGGIVGTVSYDTTRNELDPRYAAVEDWQPGVSGIPVDLYQPVDCLDVNGDPIPGAVCDATDTYQLNADGSYKLGPKINTYVTETWSKPGTSLNDQNQLDGDCIPRDVSGAELTYPAKQQITSKHTDCLEAPLMGVQFQRGFSAVDGNYGFGDGCFAPNTLGADADGNPICTDAVVATNTDAWAPLPGASDYLVKVNIPDDQEGKPQYKFTREEDINIGNGDNFVPAAPPPACVGALHTVDVAGYVPDNSLAVVGTGTNGIPLGVTVPASVATDNPTFPDGGSPYEGLAKPLCDTKLVPLANGRSIVPTFNVFTDVPLPGRFWGLVVDDLNFSGDPHQINYGEKAGIPFAPVGIYDFQNRLVYTTESDYSGLFDVLMPSTNRISCPTPSGVCPNVYRFVGNDPGRTGALNLNYNPRYRTIAAEFEAFAGLIVPADLAPTQVGVNVQLPNGQAAAVQCAPDLDRPQLYAVSRPYADLVGLPANRNFTISGTSFGTSAGSVTLDGTIPLTTTSWSNTTIAVTVPLTTAPGAHQLTITGANGLSTVNGLSFYVLGLLNRPNIYNVGPGKTYAPNYSVFLNKPPTADHAIQRALDAAAASPGDDLVIVYPNTATPGNPRFNPRGAYFENLVINAPVSLQGVGPGSADGSVPGSILDGSAFGGDGPVADDWLTLVDGLPVVNGTVAAPVPWGGNQTIQDGAVVTIYAQASGARAFSQTRRAAIDGFDIRGGNQFGFPTNLNVIGGTPTGLAPTVQTQGGAIYANAYARYLQITNNTVQNNGGAYGAIRIGTPDTTNNNNDHVRIANNRIVANAGTNLAGAIGLFEGSDHYRVDHNDLCGNFSAEYGGAISVYGRSGTGGATPTTDNEIDHNRVWFNQSYDEGAGVMIAGSLPANPAGLSQGSGPVNIHENLIEENLSNDDGGGLRFLMAGNFPMKVYNNMIVNNVAAHEGGGVALDDAPDVDFYNNTVIGNLTTATAMTSDGTAAPAGLSTGNNSSQLQATLAVGSPTFSRPVLRNNIFWDNRAGAQTPPGTPGPVVTGLGQTGDSSPIVHWDFGSIDGSGPLAPTNSMLQTANPVTNPANYAYTASPTNQVNVDPQVESLYVTQVAFDAWRTNPNFVGSILVTNTPAGTRDGNYHLKVTSTAKDTGVAIAGLTVDYDGQGRPAATGYDIGADEYLPPVSVSPSALAFGNVYVGTPSAPQTLTVQNSGTAPLTRLTVTVAAPYSRPTGAAGGTCGTTLAFGTTCTINVVFTPTAVGPTGNTLTITGSLVVGGSPVALSGTGVVPPVKPTLAVLDQFNRANANTLGTNWNQTILLGFAAIRVNANQAQAPLLPGVANWTATFLAKQGAAFTFAQTAGAPAAPVSGSGLLLKVANAPGGNNASPASYIRVQYATSGGGQVLVQTTTNGNNLVPTYTTIGTFNTGTFASGDTLTAVANADGSVDVWKTTAATATSFLGHSATSAFTGGGRIGIQVPATGRVDTFAGGTVL